VEPSRTGLTAEEARLRLARFGANLLPAARRPGLPAVLLRQLRSPLIYVLLAAAVGALALGDYTDAGFIGFVLLVNSALGAWQEWNAEQQSAALQKLMPVRATVLRDGRAVEIDAAQLVPDDVVLLESGQRVAADLQLVDAQGLEIEESMLTGESLPVLKDPGWRGTADTGLGDRRNMAFAGSSVTRGRGVGVVVATGTGTVVGGLARSMASTQGGKAPLVERTERFSRTIAVVVLGAALLIGAVGVLVHHQDVGTMFLFGVALAVSAIPEGLPVAITVALAIAARRMAARGAIVRSLPTVEGLGSCTLIASDKTGTLTCNELTVRELRLAGGDRYEVGGAGYEPVGAITPAGPDTAAGEGTLRELLEVAAACNEGSLFATASGWSWRGDPTDVALLALAGKGGVDHEALLRGRPRIHAIPYEPERRFAASFHRRDGGTWVAVKGAPERVLPMSELSPGQQRDAMSDAVAMAAAGRRVLAFAAGQFPGEAPAGDTPTEPSGLRFLGFAGLIDPLRPGAREAVQNCADAGIRVIMVTGDHPVTALAIGRDLGIATTPEDVIAGTELALDQPRELADKVAHAKVFARVTPQQKLALVEAAQQAGHFVAVTGDGVNDAPALRRANIGVAMGRGGTDIAREASDLVLSDDNFATIVGGVEEGRIAYRNIRNVVYLLVAAGLAEVLTVGVAVIAGLPLPLLPVQLLWLNLVTNGIQDVALAFERGSGDELRRPPRRPDEPMLDRLMIERGVLAGVFMAALGLSTFVWLLEAGVPVGQARNEMLLLMVLMQNVDAFNARSETRSVFRVPLRNNPLLVVGVAGALLLHLAAMYLPFMQRVLDLRPLAATEWFVLPAVALTLLGVMELQKLGWRWRRR
jgi:magnesium-transporting ATPase (P-type)